MDKTLAALEILEHCPPFLRKISDLPGLTNQLLLGMKSKIELQMVGKEAFDLQQIAANRVEKYFNILDPKAKAGIYDIVSGRIPCGNL